MLTKAELVLNTGSIAGKSPWRAGRVVEKRPVRLRKLQGLRINRFARSLVEDTPASDPTMDGP
jgi:hypothetical protein